MKLKPIQKQVADLYESGKFSDINNFDDAKNCGDALFMFCILEAGDGCKSLGTLRRRLEQAKRQLQGLVDDVLMLELNKETT